MTILDHVLLRTKTGVAEELRSSEFGVFPYLF